MFKNRIRLPLYIKQPQFPAEANRFRLANGATKTLSVVIRKTYNLVTDYLPERMHQRVTIALNHDEVKIEGDRYVGGVAVDGEYKIEWPDFLDYPLGQAEVQIQVTPFAATNDNCQTCEEVTQISLVDDTIPDPITEGDDGTMNVFTNDAICCSPITAEIMTFNTTYVEAATISELGEVVVTIKNPAPSGTNVLLATYRVTCPNGGYDEADIFGTIEGTEEACEAPSNLEHTNISAGEDEITWDAPGFGLSIWQLYTCDNLGTPIQTGSSPGNSETFLGLTQGQCYVFSVRKDCTGTYSEWSSFEFTVPVGVTNCGRFSIVHGGFPGLPADNVSYMDCDGTIQNVVVNHVIELCMLVDGLNIPIYFESADGTTNYTYDEPCANSGNIIIMVNAGIDLEAVSGITHDVAMPLSGATDGGTWIGFTGGGIGITVTSPGGGSWQVSYNGVIQSTESFAAGTSVNSSILGLSAPADGVTIEIDVLI